MASVCIFLGGTCYIGHYYANYKQFSIINVQLAIRQYFNC